MKHYTIVILLIVTSCVSPSTLKHSGNEYMIIDIKDIGNATYLLFMRHNDSVFQVISPRFNEKNIVMDTIKCNYLYNLNLTPLFKTMDEREKIILMSPLHRDGIGYRNMSVKIQNPSTLHELYITNNLNGLYLIKPSSADPITRFWNGNY